MSEIATDRSRLHGVASDGLDLIYLLQQDQPHKIE